MLQAQIFLDKDQWKGNQQLYHFVLEFLIHQKIKGATVFEGIAGFGKKHYIQNPYGLFSFDDLPIMITFVDQEEKIRQVLSLLRQEMNAGYIITHQVEIW
jgi:PII-like signaling protein